MNQTSLSSQLAKYPFVPHSSLVVSSTSSYDPSMSHLLIYGKPTYVLHNTFYLQEIIILEASFHSLGI